MKFVLSDSTPCDLSIGVGTRQTKHSTWVAPNICAIALARQRVQNVCKHIKVLGAKGEFGSAENETKQISHVNMSSLIFDTNCPSLDILNEVCSRAGIYCYFVFAKLVESGEILIK